MKIKDKTWVDIQFERDITLNTKLLPPSLQFGEGVVNLIITRNDENDNWCAGYRNPWCGEEGGLIFPSRSIFLDDALWLLHDFLAMNGILEDKYSKSYMEFRDLWKSEDEKQQQQQ